MSNLLLSSVPSLSALGQAKSLVFSGSGNVSYDRVNIALSGAAANFGNTDHAYETWLKPSSANNNTGSVAIDGSIFVDRDNLAGGTSGEFVMSILGGTLALAVSNTSFSYTEYLASATINDGLWHHILWTRQFSDGRNRVYIDGNLEINAAGPTGDLRWISGGNTNDSRLVWGVEKHAQGADLSYYGSQSETRVRNIYISDASITVPTAPMGADANTICYWPFDDGSGTTVRETVDGGNSNGAIVLNAGSPPPTWSSDSPYS